MYDAQDGAESSSLAPGPLHGRWTAIPDQMGGFDQQVSIQEVGDRSGRGCRRDSWDSWDSSIHGDGDDKRISLCGHQTTTVRDWKRVPGDTSITYGVRLYLSNLDPDISHEENCDTLLREASIPCVCARAPGCIYHMYYICIIYIYISLTAVQGC